ncbi:MAG: 7-cyano-7-deazaguanine synthase QueC [Herpetosiphon sp.]
MTNLLNSRRAVVLLSGGLDSATCAYEAHAAGFTIHALTVAYGQRHSREVAAAEAVARQLGVHEHKTIMLDLTLWGGSALTDEAIAVPTTGVDPAVIPSTYVPARNTIFLALALGYAEAVNASAIYIGVNHLDYSGYPDCRPEFIQAFQTLADLATKRTVEGQRITIETPLQSLDKVAIVRRARQLGVPIDTTWSCYAGGAEPCGVCDSCRLRDAALQSA